MSTIPSPRKGDGASPRWGLYREVFVSFPQNDATAGPGGGNVNQPLVAGAAPRKLVGMLRLDEGAVHQHVGLVEQIARGRIGDASSSCCLLYTSIGIVQIVVVFSHGEPSFTVTDMPAFALRGYWYCVLV